jgi:RNA polymerase sigma factor (sigma-70 family)
VTITQQEDVKAAFCQAEYPRLVASMTLYTGDSHLAAELAQEALARALRDWRHVEGLAAPAAWTHRVAVNLANSHFRRRRLERAARQRAEREPAASWHDEDQAVRGTVVQALARLPRRQREAVVLRYLLDLSVDAVADRMQCAPGTVRALTAQAIAALRQRPEFADLKEPTDD